MIKNNLISQIRTKLSKDKSFSELVLGSGTSFILKMSGMFFGYIYIWMVAKFMGASSLGSFTLSMTVLNIVTIVSRLGIDTSIVKFVVQANSQENPTDIRNTYDKSFFILLTSSSILFMTLNFLANFLAGTVFNKPELELHLKVVSLAILPLSFLYLNAGFMRGLKKIKEYAFLSETSKFLFSIAVFPIIFFFFKLPLTAVSAFVISIFIASTISFLLSQKSLQQLDQKNNITNHSYKEIFYTSFPMLLSSSLIFITGWTDTLMLGAFRSESEVGVYNVALKLAMLTSFVLNAVNSISAPKFAEFYAKNDMTGLARTIRQANKLIFWTSFPILLFLFLFPEFLMGVFGSEFKKGVPALLILALGQFANASIGSVGYLLQMTGRQKAFQYIVLLGSISSISLNLILIPKYGINGAAISSTISIFLWKMIAMLYIKKHYNIVTLYIPGIIK